MATLEKIRSKSVLLFVIIIVALLAFILGDFLTSGRTYFGSGTTIAKAGKAKVDYLDYQNRMNAEAEQQRNNSRNIDNDELSQGIIEQLLTEKMLENEYADLGITVTNTELSEALTGAVPHPAAQQFIFQMSRMIGLPTPSGQAVYDAMMNPQKYGLPAEAGDQLKQFWAAGEADVEQSLKQEKFGRLINGLFTANELDARTMYNDVTTSRHLAYASKPISSVQDDEVEVTDADRRAAWEEEKETYRLAEPERLIDYIFVRIEPSQADRIAGTQEVESAIASLKENPGTSSVAANPRFVVNTNTSPASDIKDNNLKEFIDSAKVGDVSLLSKMADNFTIVKLLGVTNDIDSINVTMIRRADGASLDSVLNDFRSGKPYAEIVDNTTFIGQDSLWTSLAAPGIPANLKASLETAAIGQAFVLSDTIQGQPVSTLYRINRRNAPVPFYEVALIDYTIDPSQETLSQLSNNLRTFVANNSSATDFSQNAAEAGYTIMPATVKASSPHVGIASDSRPAVKWIMNAKKGQVMPVYQDNKQTYLLTAAVKDIYDGAYMPFDAAPIADNISAKAIRNKKAAKLVDEYKGKATDVAGYAELMGVEPQEADVMFTSAFIPGIGFGESAVQGAIAAAEKGQVSEPVVGNNSVIVFTVTGEDTQGRDYDFKEYANQFNRMYGIGGARPLQGRQVYLMLLGNDKVKNNSLDFIQGFGE